MLTRVIRNIYPLVEGFPQMGTATNRHPTVVALLLTSGYLGGHHLMQMQQ